MNSSDRQKANPLELSLTDVGLINKRRIRQLRPITTESLAFVTLLIYAIERVKSQAIFGRDPYVSRREALPGSLLLKALVFYQRLKDPSQSWLA
jgi:hypothetical protein